MLSLEDVVQIKYDILREALKELKSVKVLVYGDSMYPSFKTGDVVVINYVGIYMPKVGDLLLCVGRKNNLVFHRVSMFDDKYIFVKGDNENYMLKIDRRRILGVYGDTKLKIEEIDFKNGIVKIFSKKVGSYNFRLILQDNLVRDFCYEEAQ